MIEYLVLANPQPKRGGNKTKKGSKRMARSKKKKSSRKGGKKKRKVGISLRFGKRTRKRATLTVRGKKKASARVRRKGKRTVVVYARRNAGRRRRRNPASAMEMAAAKFLGIGREYGRATGTRSRSSGGKRKGKKGKKGKIVVRHGKGKWVGRKMSRRKLKSGGVSYRLNPAGGLRSLMSVRGVSGVLFSGAAVGAGAGLAITLPGFLASKTGVSQLNSGWTGIAAQAALVTVVSGMVGRFAKSPRLAGLLALGGSAVVAGNVLKKVASMVPALQPVANLMPVSGGLSGLGYYGWGVNDYLQLSGMRGMGNPIPAMGIAGGMGEIMTANQLNAAQAFYGNMGEYLQINPVGDAAIPSANELEGASGVY